MASQRKKQTANSYAHSLLKNSLAVGLFGEEKIRHLLTDFVINSNDKHFEGDLLHILQSKRIRSFISAFSKSVESFSTRGFYISVRLSRLMRLYATIFRAASKELQTFVTFRDKIEDAILFAQYENANLLLDDLELQFGESVWLCRTKMLVLSGLGDRDAFERYCEYCGNKSKGTLNAFIFKCSQLIADSGNAALQLRTVVERNVIELREAKELVAASLLEVMFYPYPLEASIDPLHCLPYLQAFPFIDQYELITTIIRYELTKTNVNEEISAELQRFAAELKSIVIDEKTLHLSDIDLAVDSGPSRFIECSARLYNAYGRGDYETAVAEFQQCRENSNNVLSLANVIAKAMAYGGFESTLDSRSPPIVNVTSGLATIYRLSPLWSQAEEELLSLCIKYKHFAHSAHIQLALLKALPFRYERDSQRVAARIAISLANTCTPQTFEMAGAPIDVSAFSEIEDSAPPYRRLKLEILDELSSGHVNTQRIDSALSQLWQSEALAKDILECNSQYYLTTEQDQKLLNDAASNLIMDGNRFLCYPMSHLVDYIEREELHDIHAIIIAYHYNKSVTDERDYILNEAFERYLAAAGVVKPSQLLLEKTSLTPEERVFFRDVCVPDVMDYLGCFKNSNDLRSERIIILDTLERMNAIESKTRMREVEDIVRQVIVDAGTSELNGAKIFVDDSAIRKKHNEEVKSLLALYEKLPQGGDERYTNIDSDNSKGGYISGNRNSLIERLYIMLSGSFVLDDKYGLDKNLSAEIRHGFFSNLMRARLEELHLLTELDEKGEYLPNVYWRERNSLVRDAFWDEIDKILQGFSRRFDDTIAHAEEWMKINIQSSSAERMFSYELDLEEFAQLKEIVTITGEVEYVTSYILELLWKKTERALAALRERLNGEFKSQIDLLFSETIDSLSVTKGDLALFDLMQAFTRARNDIKEDINTASEWFNKNENSEITAGTLDRLIEIAVRSFEKVRGNAYSIIISTPADLGHVAVNKQVAKPFILAIINLLDNCYTHSGLGQATRVEISGKLNDFLATVIIRNTLSTEKQSQLDAERLATIKGKLEGSDISKHIRGEGGTGLIKANHEIKYLGQRSTLQIARHLDFFEASISYSYDTTI